MSIESRVDAGRFNPSGVFVIGYDNALYGILEYSMNIRGRVFQAKGFSHMWERFKASRWDISGAF
jgi:hypothetical protein